MFPFFEILNLIVKTLSFVLVEPIYWAVIIVMAFQYRNLKNLERNTFNLNNFDLKKQIADSILFGILGGFLGSIIMVFIGVTIQESGLLYVFILAVLLTMINPRYMCFSYAGGILSLFSLIFGFPRIDVSSLMAIIGILHLIESFLIWLDGYRGRLPVFVEGRDGQIVAGFTMQRFWPIPITVLVLGSMLVDQSSAVNMPNWWPLIKPYGIQNLDNVALLLMVAPAALGYADVAITEMPKDRCRKSAALLSVYSILLIMISVISSYVYVFKYVAAIFAPVVHELQIIIGQKREMEGKPLFVPPERGIMVLDVKNFSPAYEMGLTSGDVILSINGIPINDEEDLRRIFIDNFFNYVWLEVMDLKGRIRICEYRNFREGIRQLGILVVPKGFSEQDKVLIEFKSPLKLFRNLFKKS